MFENFITKYTSSHLTVFDFLQVIEDYWWNLINYLFIFFKALLWDYWLLPIGTLSTEGNNWKALFLSTKLIIRFKLSKIKKYYFQILS